MAGPPHPLLSNRYNRCHGKSFAIIDVAAVAVTNLKEASTSVPARHSVFGRREVVFVTLTILWMPGTMNHPVSISRRPRPLVLVGQSFLVGLCVVAAGTPATAVAQPNTQRGAVLGGLGGAIAGAIIGENNDEAGGGAAIGGAIGAVAGGLLGNARDRELSAPSYYRQTVPTPSTYTPPVPTGAVSFGDVVAMCRSGVSENVIMNQIQTRGVQRRPQVSDIISLHQQGVSEVLISAMQQAPLSDQVAAQSAAPSRPPVVVHDYHVQPYPVPVYRPPVRYRHRGYHYHFGF